MNKIYSKLIPIIIILSISLLFYYLMFYGVTYKFKSKMKINPKQSNEVIAFNKTFHKDEIKNITIVSDASFITIEKSNSDFIEISSKYNSQALFYAKLKSGTLTIKQYANIAQEKDVAKNLLIKLPSKDFNKLKISSPILTVNLKDCYFKYIDIKAKISTIDLNIIKPPQKTKLYIETGNINLNVPKSKNNKFKILTSRSELIFFDKKYQGFIYKEFGNGFNFFDICCFFGVVFIY